MEREILFRGKTEKGEWVEGFYTKGFRDPQQKQLDDLIYMFSGKSSEWDFDYARVIPETVGQFTGLTDKNGKKIFEGDIVKEKDCVHNGEIQIKGDVFKIRFLDNGIFCADNGGWWDFIDEIGEIEIIGNIHDNPELLEVDNA